MAARRTLKAVSCPCKRTQARTWCSCLYLL